MSDPKHAVMGNKADELGAHEEGADFAGVNQSPIPALGEHVEVNVQHDGKNITLIPSHQKEVKRHAPIELQDGPRQMTDAGIFEDPNMLSRLSGAITRKS